MNRELTYHSFVGAQIASVFEPLAALRIAVFRSFPYLYEGRVDYEEDYLKTYEESPKALLFAVFDNGRMVGATTALPLADEAEEVQAPFVAAGYRLEDVFYFGESILLPEYRGLGIGHRFFDEREKHVRSFGRFKYMCFCAVQRPADHPDRTSDYQPLDVFWKKRGYKPIQELITTFSWPDIGETESTVKSMLFWLKEL